MPAGNASVEMVIFKRTMYLCYFFDKKFTFTASIFPKMTKRVFY